MKNFSAWQYRIIITKEGKIADGDYLIDGVTVRISDGYLNDGIDENGNILPAIETADLTHIEHWDNGVLHCENEPAVIDLIDNYDEWWHKGKKITKGF